MKYIDAEKLIAEIERHRQAIRVLNEHTAPEQTSKTCAIFQYSDTILSELLSFIDSLQQEPDKSLEEAAYKYSFESRPSVYGQVDVIDAFKVGAEWQKSQMMNEAVKADVNTYELTPGGSAYVEFVVDMPVARFKFNDKVRIIIVKEESNGKK